MESKRPVYPKKTLLLKRFRKIIKIFTKRLDDYIKDSSEDNIHDLRVAIRRLESVYRILPKKNRKNQDIQDYVKYAKELFKINTQIRDLDIIRTKLEKKYSTQFAQIVDSINNKRKHQLDIGCKLALKLKNISPPRLKEDDIIEPKLRRRFQKIVFRLAAKIDRNIPLVLGDEKRIEEIHELRKDFKKVRYSIELTTDNIESLKTIKSLKKIQDELGSIRDSDVFLDYLRDVEGPYELAETIREEIVERREKYQKFIQIFREKKIEPRKLIL